MKHGLVEKLYALILLAIFGGIVVHAPFTVYFGTLFPDAGLLIKSWKEILMLLAAPLAGMIVRRRQLWKELLTDRVMQIAAVYVSLHLVFAVAMRTGPLATMAGLAIDLRYVAFFVLVYIAMKALPEYRAIFLKVAAAGAIVVIGFAVLQAFILPADILSHIGYGKNTIQPFLTVDENREFIRINSTLRGPNPLGAYAVIVLSLTTSLFALRRQKIENSPKSLLAGIVSLGSGVALWVSYSRSALGAAFVAIAIVAFIAVRHRITRRVWILGAVVFCALAGGLVAGRESTFVSNVVLHENPGTGAEINSNEGHIESLRTGFARMLRQPIGAGVGSTGSASLLSDLPFIVENQYLFVAHEVGWLGLVIFVSLFAAILLRLWRFRRDWLSLGVLASGVGLALIGMLLPVWVDDTVSIIWWGLAAIALGSGGKHARQSSK